MASSPTSLYAEKHNFVKVFVTLEERKSVDGVLKCNFATDWSSKLSVVYGELWEAERVIYGDMYLYFCCGWLQLVGRGKPESYSGMKGRKTSNT